MTREQPARGGIRAVKMDDYKEHLRRLAVHDDALLEMIAAAGSSFVTSVMASLVATMTFASSVSRTRPIFSTCPLTEPTSMVMKGTVTRSPPRRAARAR